MDKKQKYKILAIINGSVFIALLIAYLAMVLLSTERNLNKVFNIIFVLLLSVIVCIFFLCLLRFFHQKTLMKTLQEQALYTFGQPLCIFNRNLFENQVNQIRNRKKNRNAYQALIRFTIAPEDMVNINEAREESVAFNSAFVEYLKKNVFGTPNRFVYAYDDCGYYLYVFHGNRYEIINIVNSITDEIYRISEEKNIHLYIAPFFGIEEPKPTQTVTECCENAILARNASEANFESITFYQSSMKNVTFSETNDRIIEGLKNHEFVVYYQPKFSLKENKYISAEALIRWDSPEYGLLMPSQFIPLSESSGISNELDKFVLEQVATDIEDALKRGRSVVPISLNFSLFEFFHMNFLDTIIQTLERHHVPPSLIQIEILERTSQANPFLAVSIIKKLKEKGIRVMMDDFGIGYSNIANLGKIPFDAIKIDKSYIDNIEHDEKARNILKCLIELGKLNHLEVIAEGVDNQNQINILKEYGCDTIQGFYYSKAIPRKDFSDLLKKETETDRKEIRNP